jgi:hypothetical protein
MSDHADLTFDADGFVRMDALPDVDPDGAVTPAELARLQAALHDEVVPSSVGADWDAMVADVDRIDFGDSTGLVPDDGADLDVDGPSGPIVLVEDEIDTDRSPVDFEPDAIGRTNASSTGADHGASTTVEFTSNDPFDAQLDGASLGGSDAAWATDDLYATSGDDDLTGDLGAPEVVDDLLDVDVVELHHDDGDLPGTPH